MYLSYGEYLRFGGQLEYVEYLRYEFRAEQWVDRRTFNRLVGAPISERVKRLMYELIAVCDTVERAEKNGVSSYSNDGVSTTFKNSPSADEVEAKADSLITDYLMNERAPNGVPLLYLGVV